MAYEYVPIIPDLPDDIGRECLFRVSARNLQALKSVSKIWKSLVTSRDFFGQRKYCGYTEKKICLVQAVEQPSEEKRHEAPTYGITVLDPVKKTWTKLPPLPGPGQRIPLFAQCVAVNQKLLLFGGWNPTNWEVMKTVYVFDFLTGKWCQGSDMPTARSFFASAVAGDGLVYVAGGHDDSKNALRSVDAYDVETDAWSPVPDMYCERDECEAVLADGKLFVISGYGTESQGRFRVSAECYDPKTRVWAIVDNMWNGVGICPKSIVVSDGDKGVFCVCGQDVMRYCFEENLWKLWARVPEKFKASCLTLWEGKIFVSGKDAEKNGQCFYVLEKQGRVSSWIPVDRGAEFSGFVQCAVTAEL